ncbi:hypothetical protein CQA66_05465 [Helicobacter aurati]|uniref:Uncharacterized protein n=1 Tax=Helicobacter aurati TaxID=137778 RepID=A0A3D8J610_9HELI|nr:hypothetical protein CQA66_05465 [Helicobacter aurati]
MQISVIRRGSPYNIPDYFLGILIFCNQTSNTNTFSKDMQTLLLTRNPKQFTLWVPSQEIIMLSIFYTFIKQYKLYLYN